MVGKLKGKDKTVPLITLNPFLIQTIRDSEYDLHPKNIKTISLFS